MAHESASPPLLLAELAILQSAFMQDTCYQHGRVLNTHLQVSQQHLNMWQHLLPQVVCNSSAPLPRTAARVQSRAVAAFLSKVRVDCQFIMRLDIPLTKVFGLNALAITTINHVTGAYYMQIWLSISFLRTWPGGNQVKFSTFRAGYTLRASAMHWVNAHMW